MNTLFCSQRDCQVTLQPRLDISTIADIQNTIQRYFNSGTVDLERIRRFLGAMQFLEYTLSDDIQKVNITLTVRFEMDRARIEWVLHGFVPRPRNLLKIKNCDDFEWVARFCVGFALTVNKSNAIKCRIKHFIFYNRSNF